MLTCYVVNILIFQFYLGWLLPQLSLRGQVEHPEHFTLFFLSLRILTIESETINTITARTIKFTI